METKTSQNQIVIKLHSDEQKQRLPLNLLLSLAAGTIAGVLIILGLFWGIEKIAGL